MKISKGALVVMKGKKIVNLYKLLRNTVIGGVAAFTLAESNNDDTVLWYMRLGHLGERGMFELHKQNLLKVVREGIFSTYFTLLVPSFLFSFFLPSMVKNFEN